jgi:lysine 2,3-aminomutase
MKAATLRTPEALARAGLIPSASVTAMQAVAARYAIAVPPAVAALIDRQDAADPIARQYLPDARELDAAPEDLADPIGDRRHMPLDGLVHRYPDRVLFKVVHTCPVYCRFCFRREMVGPGREPSLTPHAIERALAYIAGNGNIHEVIFTGGDPFILAPHRVRWLTDAVDAIGHVRRIRWHTRVPVVVPDRIDAEFAMATRPQRASLVVALHANHPREFTPAARDALSRLKQVGARLLSQSVLLRGVNDDTDTLLDLLAAFREAGVEPYYLHHGDRAPGTAHFRTSIREGIALMQGIRQRCPHVALPAYVLDIPGGYTKVDLMGDGAVEPAPGHWRLRDDQGHWHDYLESA